VKTGARNQETEARRKPRYNAVPSEF
jgi:hypothetical protein